MNKLRVLTSGLAGSLLETLRDCLSETEVLALPSGQTLLDFAVARNPDALLLPFTADSLAACRQIKAHRTLCYTPVVILTTPESSPENRREALAGGAAAFLSSEADPLEWLALLRSMAALRTARLRSLRAATALQDTEQKYAYLFDSAADAIIVVDRQGRILAANARAREKYGYTGSEMLALTVFELDTPECAACATERVSGVLSQGSLRFETVHRRKDGTFIPVEMNSRRITWNGEPAILGIARDVTERKQAEMRASESRAKLEAALASMPDSVFITDAEGRPAEFNEALPVLFGFQSREECNQALAEGPSAFPIYRLDGSLVRPEEGPVSRALRGETANEEYLVGHRTNRAAWFASFTFCPIRDKHGHITGSVVVARDITTRKKAERELLHSRDLMRYVLEHMHSAVAVHDRELRFLYVSRQYLKDRKVTLQDVIGKHYYEVIPDLPESWKEVHRRVLAGAVLSAEDDRWERADGSVERVRWECRPWYEADGRIGGMIVYTEIITRRKLDEEALRASERRHRAILETAMDGFFCTDLEGRFLEANEKLCRMTGYTREELLSLRIPDMEAEGPAPRFEADRGTFFERGEDRWESMMRRKDGSTLPMEISAQYKPEAGGRIVGFVRDIAERKRAEAELRESESRLRFALEGTNDGLWDVRFPGNEAYLSPRGCEILGYTPEEFALDVRSWTEVMHPEDLPETLERLQAHFAGHTPIFEMEQRLRTRSGEWKYVLTRGKLVARDSDGNPLRMTGTHTDISERKRAEEEREKLRAQLVQAQKMESIGRLAGGVAHDFNNLLTVINGYSQLALGNLRPNDPLRASLSEIYQAGQRAAALTRQLLAFSRKQILQPRVLEVNRVVQDMRSMLQRLMGEDVEVRLSLNAGAATVHADPHQLEQVIMNLAVNARDAMPAGGRLLIETSVVDRDQSHLASEPNAVAGRYARLAVSDTGVGMDEAVRQRIFEPFFTTKGAGQGTGLGLSMVQGIVAQSGGYVSVYSEPGQGTTFKIYLPVLAGATPGSAAGSAPPVVRGNETILVVEDQAEVRNFVVEALLSYGYHVLQAANAGEALIICEERGAGIHLVLTDVVMPYLGGRELASRLGKLYPRIRVLFMSGYTDNVIVHHGILDRDTDFIQKPFNPEELARKVRSVLGPPAALARVLLSGSDPAVQTFFRTLLEASGYLVVESLDSQPDIAVVGIDRADADGPETVQSLRRGLPGLGIVALADTVGADGLKSLRAMGADVVLENPVNAELLLAKVSEILSRRQPA